jgi:hypothetical protein
LAALWEEERTDDVKMLKELFDKGEPLNISWELRYKEAIDKGEYKDLTGIRMNAATIVRRPAYGGRTPILALASDESKEENNLEELEILKQAKIDLEAEVARLGTALAESNGKLDEVKATASTLEANSQTVLVELEELRQYKKGIETAKAAEDKFVSIKTLFSETGLNLPDTYFTERKEKLISMSDEDLKFHVQDLLAFGNNASASINKNTLPPLTGNTSSAPKNPKEIAKMLRELKENK